MLPNNVTDIRDLASRYPPSLRFIFKSTVTSLRVNWLSGGGEAWPCLRNTRWPRDAHAREKLPPRLWVFASEGSVCIAGYGWANRAEQTAAMLMRGLLAVHNRLALHSNNPSAYRLTEFKHVVSINLFDFYWYGTESSRTSQLAYACKGDRPSMCGVGLVPHFMFENYYEVGVAEFPELSQRLAAIGSRPAHRRVCGWAGNPKNHEQRGRFAAQADLHPELLASPKGFHLPLELQVQEWACMVDLVGFGFSARAPLLLHSGRVLLKVTPPAPTPWLWYEDAAVFPEILVPWKHFVPVEADLSDLVQRVQWIQNNPSKADRIGAAGQAYARRYLTRDRSSEYLARQVLIAGQCGNNDAPPNSSSGRPCAFNWASNRAPSASSVASPAAGDDAAGDGAGPDRWDELLEGYSVGA